MKKLALAVVAVASLGLAACEQKAAEADANATNVEATTENAVEDVTAAVNAADNALDNVGAVANTANAQ